MTEKIMKLIGLAIKPPSVEGSIGVTSIRFGEASNVDTTFSCASINSNVKNICIATFFKNGLFNSKVTSIPVNKDI